MKLSTNLFVAAVVLLLGFACSFVSHAQSQGEMNLEAEHHFEAADAKLNKVYKQLMEKIDQQSQTKLRTSQRAWIAFRDAQADLQEDFEARGGTMGPTVYSTCRTNLTEARTSELEKLIKDYCN